MRFLSLFSGVGGMDLGLERAGHEIVAMCEIDKHARGVLAHHWPTIPLHEDVTTLDGRQYRGRIDAVSGGSPCQDLSVAGRRAGLDGSRSGLFWHQCRIADEAAAPWVIWENVPGALTSNKGADFAAVLWGLTGAQLELPHGGKWRTSGVVVGPKRWAVWRLLDAQHFGVPQRRRRVFVVASATAPCRPEILLESESLRWDRPSSRKTRQETAGTLGTRPTRNDLDGHGAYIVDQPASSTTVNNRSNTEAPHIVNFDEFNFTGGEEVHHSIRAGTKQSTGVLISSEAPQVFTEGQFANYVPGAGTIRAAGGTLGGGSENLVVEEAPQLFTQTSFAGYTEGVGTLRATDYKTGDRNIVIEEVPQVFGQTEYAGYTEGVATLTNTGYKRPEDNIVTYIKAVRSGARDENGELPAEVWREQPVAPTLNQFDNNHETRATVLCFGWQEQHYAGDVHIDQATALTTTKTQAVFIDEVPKVVAPTLTAANDPSRSPQSEEITRQVEAVHQAGNGVRRLTPVECERLMGWPDGWTEHRADGTVQADAHRYKQCGNGVVAPVAEWIGHRL